MKIVLYMRVSTDDQTNENQRIRLDETVNQRGWTLVDTYQDQESGAKRSRPGLDQLLKDARAGRFDLVLVTKVDRISRSLQDLLEIAAKLGEYNVSLSFTDQPIDISSSMGKAFFQILGAFAELERSMIIERTKAGLRRARREGKRIGRPPLHHETRNKVQRLREKGKSMREISRETGLSIGTVHKTLTEKEGESPVQESTVHKTFVLRTEKEMK